MATKSSQKYFYLKDHWVRRVTINSLGAVKGYDDYYPFGLQMPYRNNNTSNPNANYKYSGKELDQEWIAHDTSLDWYWFNPGRYYDPEIGIFRTVDPHDYNYPSLNPYHYVGNNPMAFIDPTGMDTLSFNSDGSFTGDVKKDDTGNYYGTYTDEDGNIINFTFNDATDAQSIISSLTDHPDDNADGYYLTGINIGSSTGDALLRLNVAAGKNSPFLYPLMESFGEGKMDYINQIYLHDQSIDNNATVIDGVGYNNYDLGNYYWGQTMGKFGYSQKRAAQAANIYERVKNFRKDHPTDQRAIKHGVRNAKK